MDTKKKVSLSSKSGKTVTVRGEARYPAGVGFSTVSRKRVIKCDEQIYTRTTEGVS